MAWNPFFPQYGCIATFASCEQQNALLLGSRREISKCHRARRSMSKYFFLIFKEGGLESMINQRKIKFVDTKEKGWDRPMTNWLDGFKLFYPLFTMSFNVWVVFQQFDYRCFFLTQYEQTQWFIKATALLHKTPDAVSNDVSDTNTHTKTFHRIA